MLLRPSLLAAKPAGEGGGGGGTWILAANVWNDSGVWIDADSWMD